MSRVSFLEYIGSPFPTLLSTSPTNFDWTFEAICQHFAPIYTFAALPSATAYICQHINGLFPALRSEQYELYIADGGFRHEWLAHRCRCLEHVLQFRRLSRGTAFGIRQSGGRRWVSVRLFFWEIDEGHSRGIICGQRQAEIQAFNKTPTTIGHLGTGDSSLFIDPIGFEHGTVGFADPFRKSMFESDKAETSELGQRSFNFTWINSTIPDNIDGNNIVLSGTTTSAAPGSSRECSCITCLDLGSCRATPIVPYPTHCPCRLPDCNFSKTGEAFSSAYYVQKEARTHEKNHFRHDGQFRCIEVRCVYGTKRWSDLRRHYTGKHCLNPKQKFPCPEIGCKYSGNNGFKREDKLKSHRRTVHEKVAKPEKRYRVNKPNAQGAA